MSDTAFFELPANLRCGSSGFGRSGDPRSEARCERPGCAAIRSAKRAVSSVRIPVTPENRGVLRELRARELALWEDTPGDAGASPRGSLDTPREDRESQLILMLLGATALAIWLHTTVAAMRFVEGWDSFRGWIAAIVGG